MSRIKIDDLPILEDLTRAEAKGIFGGSVTFSVNELSVSHKSSSSGMATFPDVCKTPAGAGLVLMPLPYPNIGTAADGTKATKTKATGTKLAGTKGVGSAYTVP